MSTKRYVHFIGVGIGVIVLLTLPPFLSPYWVGVLTEMLVFGLFAASLDIITGYTGFPSLGHAAFFGTGAYTLGILLVRYNIGQGLSTFLSVAMVIVLSAILTPLALRARGTYFLFITLALAQCLWAIAWRWISMTGGHDGLRGISRPDLGLSWWALSEASGFYYFVLLLFILAILVLYLITKSPFGQTLVGIRESESRMRSLGYNVWLHAYLAFVIGALFAGFAGILFAWYNRCVSPGQLGVQLSTEGLLMVILGGGGTLFGPLLGAFSITFLKHFLSLFTKDWLLIMGAIYIIAIIYMPQGIVGRLRRR